MLSLSFENLQRPTQQPPNTAAKCREWFTWVFQPLLLLRSWSVTTFFVFIKAISTAIAKAALQTVADSCRGRRVFIGRLGWRDLGSSLLQVDQSIPWHDWQTISPPFCDPPPRLRIVYWTFIVYRVLRCIKKTNQFGMSDGRCLRCSQHVSCLDVTRDTFFQCSEDYML